MPMSEVTEPAIDPGLQQHLRMVARYCEKRVESVLQERRAGGVIAPLVQHLYEVLDYEIAQIFAAGSNPQFADQEGALTCGKSPSVTIPEAIIVAEFLQDRFTPLEIAGLLKAVHGGACPFSPLGKCLIRECRPLACRGSSPKPGTA